MIRLENHIGKEIFLFLQRPSPLLYDDKGGFYRFELAGVEGGGIWVQYRSLSDVILAAAAKADNHVASLLQTGALEAAKVEVLCFIPYAQIVAAFVIRKDVDELLRESAARPQ